MTTILASLALTIYMIVSPARWLKKLMQLTPISLSFKISILALGVAYLLIAWVAENYLLPRLARGVGLAKQAVTKKAKKRKEYKLISERMQI
jgi:cation-transporting P-type ATPase 13A2